MGWESTKVGSNIRTKKYLEWEIKRLYPELELVKIVEGKTEFGQKPFFVALKRQDNSVFGMVVLTKRKNGTVTQKRITENEGPTELPPVEFVRLLTPTNSVEAIQWRNWIR